MMLSSMSMRVCTAAELSWGTADVASARTALAAGGLPSSGCASCRRALIPLATAVTAASSAARRLFPQCGTQNMAIPEIYWRDVLSSSLQISPLDAVSRCVRKGCGEVDEHSKGVWQKQVHR